MTVASAPELKYSVFQAFSTPSCSSEIAATHAANSFGVLPGMPVTTRFGVAPFSKYFVLCRVAATSDSSSRTIGVIHDMPRSGESGSGNGDQCAMLPGKMHHGCERCC